MADWSELKRLAEAATPGPWAYEAHGDTGEYGVGFLLDENDQPVEGRQESGEMLVAEPVAPEVSGATNAAFIAAANPAAILALIAESEERAMFELIHGGRASELVSEVHALRAEVRRLKILVGEPVPPLPEEFVGPMPESCYARLRRKLQERVKSETQGEEQLRADLSAERSRAAVLEQNCAEMAEALERARQDAERYRGIRRVANSQGYTDERFDAQTDARIAHFEVAMGKGGRADG